MLDWSNVVIALCGLLGSCMGSWGGLRLMSYRIEQLEKKVEKHNCVMERTFIIERDMAVANHRISDLEEIQKEGHSHE